MKRRLILSGLLAGALALSLCACTRSDPVPSPTPAPTPTPTPEVTATPEPSAAPVSALAQWGEQSFARSFAAGDGETVLEVSYTLPLVRNTDECPAGAVINEWYKEEGSKRLAEAEESYESVVADYDVSKVTGFPFTPTVQEMTSSVTRCDLEVVSVRREWYISSGAAYPSIFRLSEQFDAQTGTKLSFTDFFTDADAVQDRAVAALMAQDQIRDGGFDEAAIRSAFQPENFYLTDEGVVFWIQGNTLPALHTPVEATLSYDSLKDVSIHG